MAITQPRRVVGEAAFAAPGELQTGGHGGAQRLAVLPGVDEGRVDVAREVVPVCALGGDLGVEAFVEDFGVEKDGFAGLFRWIGVLDMVSGRGLQGGGGALTSL